MYVKSADIRSIFLNVDAEVYVNYVLFTPF